jgi:O-antigen/teichoic acid export membrane protein
MPDSTTSGEPTPPLATPGGLSPEFDPLAVTESGHAGRLARGALLQQGAQVMRLVGGFYVVTLLAHRLSFSQLGTYTLLLSMITYVMFLKASVMNAAVLGVAEAAGRKEADRLNVVLSTGFVIYTAIGIFSGVLLCGIGLAVLPALHIPHHLHSDAELGVIGLSVATLMSWPLQIFDDFLRGLQRFSAVGILEISAMVIYMVGASALAFTGAPIWTLVTFNAGIPFLQGLACLLALKRLGISVRVSRGLVERQELRRFGSFSSLLIVSGVADLATYSVDRFILSAVRGPGLVGQYEGPLGAQNMIRYLNGVLSAPGVPVGASFLAAGDRARARELAARALRYSYAITMPIIVIMIIDSGPVLRAWLGDRFGVVATPAAIFTSWWILGSMNGMVGMVVFAGRHMRQLIISQWSGAAVNLGLTIVFTIKLGIYGPIIGAVSGYAVSLIYLAPFAMRTIDLSWRSALRDALLPSYAVGIGLAGLLFVARDALHLTSKPAIVATLVIGPLLYWAAYGAAVLRPDERRLVLDTVRPRRS